MGEADGTAGAAGPRVRDGSFFAGLAGAAHTDGAGRKSDVHEVYTQGVRIRRVDEPVPVLARSGLSKRQVSRQCTAPKAERSASACSHVSAK